MRELTRLVQGLGMAVASTLIASRVHPAATAVLGAGKLQELRARLQELAPGPDDRAPLVVVDGSLRPGQLRQLQQALEAPVVDRTDIILRVFARRARTRTAQLEVELARLRYEAPRVRDDDRKHGREGGGGRGERGHTNVQLRKQEIRGRMADLTRELEGLRAVDERQREKRAGAPRVALVGYTNAGKSSLLRALTGSDVLIEDQLFATLATTVRALAPATAPRILLADTVGFIENLPHELVASFRSTLEEAREADLLLLVVDAADPSWRQQLQVTRETLATVGAAAVPALVLLNKIDRLDGAARMEVARELPEAIQVSALQAEDAGRVREQVVAFFDQQMEQDALQVPTAQGNLLGEIRTNARVLAETYDEHGAQLLVRALPEALQRWRRLLPARTPPETATDILALARRHGLDLSSGENAFDQTGLDFRVLHAMGPEGRPWVLRVPRRPEVVEAARVEARTLQLVRPRLPVAVPDWQVHAPDLIAYPRLAGTPAVTMDAGGAPTWNLVDPQAPSPRLLASLAGAVAALQAIPVETARKAGVPVKDLAQVRAALRQAMDRTREALQPPDALWARWQSWLDSDTGWPPHLALAHGDLHPGHLLLDGDGTLVGILDWTEAAVTDPSVDLALLYGSFGPAAFAQLLALFETAGGRTWPGLLEHTANRWAAFPALVAHWGQLNSDPGVVAFARSLMAT